MNSKQGKNVGEETVLMSPLQSALEQETTVKIPVMEAILTEATENRSQVQETLQIPKKVVEIMLKIGATKNPLDEIMGRKISNEQEVLLLCQTISYLEIETEKKTKFLRYALSRSDLPEIPLRTAKNLFDVKNIDQPLVLIKLNKKQVPKKRYMYELLSVIHDPRTANLLFNCFGYKIIDHHTSTTTGTLTAEIALRAIKEGRIHQHQQPGLVNQIKPPAGEKKLKELMQLMTSLSHPEAIQTLFERYGIDMDYVPKETEV